MLFKAIYDLQCSGNVDINGAVGREGTVYTDIPAHGRGQGQVRVVIDQRARFYPAVSDEDVLLTSATVLVKRVRSDRTLVVSAA